MALPIAANSSKNDLASYMYILIDELPCRKSWNKPWICMIQELDEDTRAFSRVRQTYCEVWQSTTRYNISTERDESNALKINWSCCFQQRKKELIVEKKPVELSETWDGGQDIEP